MLEIYTERNKRGVDDNVSFLLDEFDRKTLFFFACNGNDWRRSKNVDIRILIQTSYTLKRDGDNNSLA